MKKKTRKHFPSILKSFQLSEILCDTRVKFLEKELLFECSLNPYDQYCNCRNWVTKTE